MSETIGQHQQAAPTNPQNGQSPMDADVVRGNDAAVVAAHNAHDSDASIHLQGGALGARPLASLAPGAKWLDTTALTLSYSTGAAWVPLGYLLADGSVPLTGALQAATDNALDLGTGAARFRAAYVGTVAASGTVASSQAGPTTPAFNASGGASAFYAVNGVKVLGVAPTGWSQFSGGGSLRNCTGQDTTTVSLDTLAAIVNALVIDLKVQGVLRT